MEKVHGGTTESLGWALVASLETFRGCSIKFASKGSGFNGISISKSGETRKIELKTVSRSDSWFAINGLTGIKKLFFDENYWLYFSLLPENIVIIVKALPFFEKQVDYRTGKSLLEQLKVWIKQTERITADFGLQFIPRINFKVRVPIRQMLREILDNPKSNDWQRIAVSVWKLGGHGYWEKLYGDA
ncbi:hypothetical protein ES703_80448 [subsurface metagenome]